MESTQRTPPESILLVRFGTLAYTKDGKQGEFRFAPDNADAVIEEFTARKRDVVIDYEHGTLSENVAPAAGWIDRLEKTPEGLSGHVKYWTDSAKDYLKNGEYRYFSPTLLMTGGKPAALHSVALTNHPALHGVDALVANDLTIKNSPESGGKDRIMTKTEEALRKLLGDGALALSDTTDDAVAGRLLALAEELPGLRDKAAKCDLFEASDLQRKKETVFDRGSGRGAFCNAQKETLMKLSLEDLEKHEKATPDNAAFPASRLASTDGETDGKKKCVLSDAEKEMAKKMNLTDEEFLAARKEQEDQED